jgi:hypothetical protein
MPLQKFHQSTHHPGMSACAMAEAEETGQQYSIEMEPTNNNVSAKKKDVIGEVF